MGATITEVVPRAICVGVAFRGAVLVAVPPLDAQGETTVLASAERHAPKVGEWLTLSRERDGGQLPRWFCHRLVIVEGEEPKAEEAPRGAAEDLDPELVDCLQAYPLENVEEAIHVVFGKKTGHYRATEVVRRLLRLITSDHPERAVVALRVAIGDEPTPLDRLARRLKISPQALHKRVLDMQIKLGLPQTGWQKGKVRCDAKGAAR